ncbi:PREDICTED: uncharacterized protein LOC106750103 isoform X2 [Dinoponera quadriceps]|uniref:Uncharacterized protein LOC106750103 isoform X2 n=1 Tax=Dinoponera quadriceps TaxID=609295 RepID=A0A6P3Y5R6_DINQU|nr:PREDICTED: uncharacterized protein LOC106750103 isoform X2 [Dinoponera quadriceps]
MSTIDVVSSFKPLRKMGTSRQEDRSLSGGISLPQWMKGKMDKFDFDDTTFQSPPTYDDSFFYLRYQKSQSSNSSQQELKRISEVLSENNITDSTNQKVNSKTISDLSEPKHIDFSKHPLPCHPFIPATNSAVGDIQSEKKYLTTGNIKLKSQGTDDGFHGEPALCGKSIVHVANQMMSGKFAKLFTSDSRQQQTESSLKNVSKSLPASPLATPTGTPDSSPKARRKIHANRYFSGAFVPDKEKYQGSWILASMLGQSREIVTAKIEEEDEFFVEPNKPLHRKKSISSQNLTYIGKEEKSADKTPVYVNMPSELREMNCWSPTSM